jgi:hypothetical protein
VVVSQLAHRSLPVKVELGTHDDHIERMLFAGTSLDKARAIFAHYTRHRPAARLTIRQRACVLASPARDIPEIVPAMPTA